VSVFLDFILMGMANEPLELGMLNLLRRWTIDIVLSVGQKLQLGKQNDIVRLYSVSLTYAEFVLAKLKRNNRRTNG
jgi:hypothetical protein